MRDQEIVGLYEAYNSIYSNVNEETEQLDEFSPAASKAFDSASKKIQGGLERLGVPINRTQKGTTTQAQQQQKVNQQNVPEEVETDLFDYILEHLVAEGYADTNEAAVTIMANMSEDWRESIVEAQEARNNPEDYEERQRKLKSKKQKAMEDPDRGINSRAFAAFMKKQMGR